MVEDGSEEYKFLVKFEAEKLEELKDSKVIAAILKRPLFDQKIAESTPGDKAGKFKFTECLFRSLYYNDEGKFSSDSTLMLFASVLPILNEEAISNVFTILSDVIKEFDNYDDGGYKSIDYHILAAFIFDFVDKCACLVRLDENLTQLTKQSERTAEFLGQVNSIIIQHLDKAVDAGLIELMEDINKLPDEVIIRFSDIFGVRKTAESVSANMAAGAVDVAASSATLGEKESLLSPPMPKNGVVSRISDAGGSGVAADDSMQESLDIDDCYHKIVALLKQNHMDNVCHAFEVLDNSSRRAIICHKRGEYRQDRPLFLDGFDSRDCDSAVKDWKQYIEQLDERIAKPNALQGSGSKDDENDVFESLLKCVYNNIVENNPDLQGCCFLNLGFLLGIINSLGGLKEVYQKIYLDVYLISRNISKRLNGKLKAMVDGGAAAVASAAASSSADAAATLGEKESSPPMPKDGVVSRTPDAGAGGVAVASAADSIQESIDINDYRHKIVVLLNNSYMSNVCEAFDALDKILYNALLYRKGVCNRNFVLTQYGVAFWKLAADELKTRIELAKASQESSSKDDEEGLDRLGTALGLRLNDMSDMEERDHEFWFKNPLKRERLLGTIDSSESLKKLYQDIWRGVRIIHKNIFLGVASATDDGGAAVASAAVANADSEIPAVVSGPGVVRSSDGALLGHKRALDFFSAGDHAGISTGTAPKSVM